MVTLRGAQDSQTGPESGHQGEGTVSGRMRHHVVEHQRSLRNRHGLHHQPARAGDHCVEQAFPTEHNVLEAFDLDNVETDIVSLHGHDVSGIHDLFLA